MKKYARFFSISTIIGTLFPRKGKQVINYHQQWVTLTIKKLQYAVKASHVCRIQTIIRTEPLYRAGQK